MAHDIEQQSNGDWSFVAAREPGWHNLGKVYPDKTGLDLNTVLTDLNVGEIVTGPVRSGVEVPWGWRGVEIPGKKMTIRKRLYGTDPVPELTPLGVVGDDYTVLSEAEVFAWTQNIVDASGAVFETAMLLDGGKKAAVTLRFPDGVLIGGVDPVDLFLVASFAHDGSAALAVMATPIRVVCQNTLTWGMKAAQQMWKIRHTKHAHKQITIDLARRNLDLSFAYFGAWADEAEQLLKVDMSKGAFNKIISALYDPTQKTGKASKFAVTQWEKREDKLMELFTGPTSANVAGTAWAALNAITEEIDWFRPTREVATDDKPAHMFERSVMGDQTPAKDRAHKIVKEYAGV